ncbi:hypothetical protein [Bacillus inaquosorum]|uniref:hypothetical protein n=1 Tax=Bacillus inaquosorum TaxID=483913 RepID=UPI003F5CC65D
MSGTSHETVSAVLKKLCCEGIISQMNKQMHDQPALVFYVRAIKKVKLTYDIIEKSCPLSFLPASSTFHNRIPFFLLILDASPAQ